MRVEDKVDSDNQSVVWVREKRKERKKGRREMGKDEVKKLEWSVEKREEMEE